ncbi:hypothetical protein FRB98_007988, partial [Tulasnella sp. 332]
MEELKSSDIPHQTGSYTRNMVATGPQIVANEQPLHLALTVSEILHLYFSYLSPQELLEAASVCQLWSLHALDSLWRERLVPYSALLHQLKWLEYGMDIWRGKLYRLCKSTPPVALQLEEWPHFVHRYPHKVTQLHLDVAVEDEVLARLQTLQETTGLYLFPNVRYLGITTESRLPIASIVNKSPIRDIILEGYAEESIAPVIEELAHAFPHIPKMTVYKNGIYGSPLTTNFGGFRDLQVIKLEGISWDSWDSLSGCHSLRDVMVTQILDPEKKQAAYVHDDGRGGAKNTFPALQTLCINESYECHIPLSGTSMPCLRHITASCLNDPGEGICVGLAQRSRSLETVKLAMYDGRLSSRTMEAFATLPDLRTLQLTGSVHAMEVVDGDIDLLARSLPKLRILILDVELDSFAYGCRFTASSLFSLARCCPFLVDITLPLDLSAVDSSSLSAAPPPPRKLVAKLHILDVILPPDLSHLAKFLAAYYLDCTAKPSRLHKT